MPNKMLIDATHPEETRVVVLRGNRVEEFDFESANRKQLRGNIYLAKVTRVEPSLQAAFVDYGGNRHGFLAFGEIHPDYYQIPIADRQALIDEEERQQRAADAEADHRAGRRAQRERESSRRRETVRSEPVEQPEPTALPDDGMTMAAGCELTAPEAGKVEDSADAVSTAPEQSPHEDSAPASHAAEPDRHDESPTAPLDTTPIEAAPAEFESHAHDAPSEVPHHDDAPPTDATAADDSSDSAESHLAAAETEGGSEHGGNITEINGNGTGADEEVIESVGGADAMEEVPERMPRLRRQYKIQEVIKRRQVMLVQVVKEERGTKGAALTTYLSLAGRYSVLMPNTARGGGISRKITSAEDRRRLKEIAQDLEVPEGMGVILRTAGASRTKTEVKRDFEYLLRLWETVRDLTLKSTAPTLVYEEGSLIKRSIRDLYNKDIDEISVAGEAGFQEARDFMRMLMPSHAKNVKPFRDALPIFTRAGIESQLDAMFQPVVQLRSGGYIVLNQAEALVAIDVNSGRATREHHIEDTALKTNLEAAEEIARQLRLRDLAGLIVIDFIDMDEKRNNRTVERRLKEALKHDRARIQVGHISHFGLLEMSRQRIRSSVLESSTEKCPHCGGSGHVRSVSSVALQLLRALEEMLLKGATHNLIVRTRSDIALYLLNHKRAHLRALEERFQVAIMVDADASIGGQSTYLIDRGEQVHSLEQAKAIAVQPTSVAPVVAEEEDEDVEEVAQDDEAAVALEGSTSETPRSEADAGNGQARGRRRRRRGRRGEGRDNGGYAPQELAAPGTAPAETDEAEEVGAGAETIETATEPESAIETRETNGESRGDADRRGGRRRGRRGGRRNRRERNGEELHSGEGPSPSPDGAAEFEAELSHSAAPMPAEPSTEPVPYQEQPSPYEPHAAGHESDADGRHENRTSHLVHVRDDERSRHEPADTHTSAAPPAPPVPAPETTEVAAHPRRRSTVREPAPVGLAAAPEPVQVAPPLPEPPPSQPIVSSPAEEADRPRRSGWWSRRVLGKE